MLNHYLSSLPPYARAYIHHLGVINKSENTQLAYAQELTLFFQFLCDSHSEFPPSPSDLTLTHLESLQHPDLEVYLSWARTYRKMGSEL